MTQNMEIPVAHHSTLAYAGGIGWATVNGKYTELQTVEVVGAARVWDRTARKPKVLVKVRPV